MRRKREHVRVETAVGLRHVEDDAAVRHGSAAVDALLGQHRQQRRRLLHAHLLQQPPTERMGVAMVGDLADLRAVNARPANRSPNELTLAHRADA